MKAKNMMEAWGMVREITGLSYVLDRELEKEGRKVYYSEDSCYDYVCDLNTRLELNRSNGETINIWIEEEEPVVCKPVGKADLYEVAKSQTLGCDTHEAIIIQMSVEGGKFAKDADNKIYSAMVESDEVWRERIAYECLAAYCEVKGIKCQMMRDLRVTQTEHQWGGYFSLEATVITKF